MPDAGMPRVTSLSPETSEKIRRLLESDEVALAEWIDTESSRALGLDFYAMSQEKSDLRLLGEQIPEILKESQQFRKDLSDQTELRVKEARVTWAQAFRDVAVAVLSTPVDLMRALGAFAKDAGTTAFLGVIAVLLVLAVGLTASAIGERRLTIGGESGLVLETPHYPAAKFEDVRNAGQLPPADDAPVPWPEPMPARSEEE